MGSGRGASFVPSGTRPRAIWRARSLAHHVPALVEGAFPARAHSSGGWCGARTAPGEKYRKKGRSGVMACWNVDPVHGLIRHVGHEIVARCLRRLDAVGAVDDRGRPVIGRKADEAIELLKALAGGPEVEGPRRACLPRRCLVPLAEGSRIVAVQPEDFGDGRRLRGESGSCCPGTRCPLRRCRPCSRHDGCARSALRRGSESRSPGCGSW